MRVSHSVGRFCAAASCFLAVQNAVASETDASINISLRTSFVAAPYLVELLETAALENSTSYFPLLDRVAEGVFSDLTTDEELYQKFVKILQEDGHLASSEALSSFNFALSLHAAAPRIEAHFQHYNTSIGSKMMAAQDAACPVWVLIDGHQFCSPALERAQQPIDLDEADDILPFDRMLGDASDTVISTLYADITHPLFGQFHETVSQTAIDGKTSYRVRYRPPLTAGQPLYIGGYGTELVLKRTDYIVIDDRDTANTDDVKAAFKDGNAKTPDFKPLTTSELTPLGLSTGSYIMSKEINEGDPFAKLLQVSADFPKYSSAIAEHNYTTEFLTEHLANREKLLPAGFNVMWMNGLQIEQRQINAYSLLDMMRRERKLIGQLQDIGLTPSEAINLLSHDALAQALAGDEPPRFDWRDQDDGGNVIIWMNNVETDRRYSQWPTALRMLMQRTYPGQLPQVRRDIHNLVVTVDLSNIRDLELLVNALQSLVSRLVPLRIGFVPVGESQRAIDMTKLSYHTLDIYGISGVMALYENIVESKKGLMGMEDSFAATIESREAKADKLVMTYQEILESDHLVQTLSATRSYRARLALDGVDSPVLMNGAALSRDETWFDKISDRLFRDHRTLQVAVYENSLPDDTWVPQFFLATANTRRNELVVPNDLKSVQVIGVADLAADFASSFLRLPRLAGSEASLLSEQAHVIAVQDICDPAGVDLLRALLEFHKKHSETEIMLVHNPSNADQDCELAHKLYVKATSSPIISDADLGSLLDEANGIIDSTESAEEAVAFWTAQQYLIRRLGLLTGQRGLFLNGRVVGPINATFTSDDMDALLAFETIQRVAPVTTAITGLGLEDRFREPLNLAKVTSIVARSLKSDVPEGMFETPPPIRIKKFQDWATEQTSIHLPSKQDGSIQIVAVIDPASETVQPWIPILKVLSELEGVDIRIFLNPRNTLDSLPIKRFYRQVVNSAPAFDGNGNLVRPGASFSDIPQDTLFNLGMILPPSWLVAPDESMYDPENIKLSSVPAGQNVDAVYKLEHILIEGHSRDVTTGQPPRGVQLLLTSGQNSFQTDTLIMANLGYFQFKANPGHYRISLKPGRSSKIFKIDSVGAKGYQAQPGDESTEVALLSFQGTTLYPRLSRQAGMEQEDVLETAAGNSAMDLLGKGASSAFSALSSLGLKKARSGNADINIFSVASGHLYERMLNIMMVSVMRHTTHTVKFWFIEQFLSPSFKAQLPVLATHYGFDFELVTYKWPHWLRAQKEKQREIWGYKILFLDVLFPLSLDKVIFVDADQIVRTDMMNLNKVDLEGAPYGFTPMCDSRTEMEGFRFWKQGYWKGYLEGKPYHISALYVVDLKRFRELAAGDRLRQQYQALSADPNSLSNLDQDLPNHMQHMLPIHSLSQEWLWCETWCSDESLADAKTIDLCNNPQTKEPKLDRARRQVPEWTEYDDEIARVLWEAQGLSADSPDDHVAVSDGSVQEEEQQRLRDEVRKKDEL